MVGILFVLLALSLNKPFGFGSDTSSSEEPFGIEIIITNKTIESSMIEREWTSVI